MHVIKRRLTFDLSNNKPQGTTAKKMTTVTTKKGYEITWNGSSMWFVNDCTGTCLGYFDSLRKATNKLEKILSYQA